MQRGYEQELVALGKREEHSRKKKRSMHVQRLRGVLESEETLV